MMAFRLIKADNLRLVASSSPLILSSVALSSAGALKLQAYLASGDRFLSSEAAIAAFEIALAMLIASGVAKKFVSIITATTFLVFAIYLFPRVWKGVPDCGCFGAISVSPLITLGFDLSVLGLFMAFPTTQSRHVGQYLRITWLIALLLFSATSTIAGGRIDMAVQSLASGKSFVVLQPSTWVGQRLPVLDSINLGDRFGVGEWILILHQSGCSACRAIHEEYEHLGVLSSETGQGPSVAFVEVPYPGKPLSSPRAKQNKSYEITWLDESTNWVAPTPVVLRLTDGIVTEVEQHSEPGSSKRSL